MKNLFFSVVFLITTLNSTAQAIEWSGGEGDWNVSANWDCDCVPGFSDSVSVLDGIVTIPPGFPVFSELITVGVGGSLINHDTLIVANAGAEGLVIEGSFENHGKLVITEALHTGLSIKSSGTVINLGRLEIDSIDATGIGLEGSAVLINEGFIDIVSQYNRYGIYDDENGSTLNATGAMINIYGGYPFASAMNIDGQLTNEGDIHLFRGDFTGLGKLINNGNIIMDNPLDDPQQGLQVHRIVNGVNGTIQVAHTSSWAFVFNDTIINHGAIEVSNTFTDAFYIAGTYFVNHGTISIDSSGRFGMLTGVNTVLRNETGGLIEIANTKGTGLRIERIQLYNNGLITMDTVGSNVSADSDHGIECVINGSMYNDTLGQILIDSCFASGLSLATAFTSANHGLIHIRHARQNGIALSSNHIFPNSGRIDIDTIQGVGIILTSTTTTFHNTGEVIIGPKMDLTDFSINNSCVFVNDTCGYISTINKLRNSGTFSNHGFLKNRSANAHTFTAGGTTTNAGVMEDYTGFIFSNANMDNLGIILNSRTSTGCPAHALTNALSLGANDDYSITGVYADIPGRSLIATYDSLSNIATQSDIFPATGDWLWVIQNIHSGCQDTMRMKVTVACPIACSTGDTNYWTGCLATDEWTSAGNWTSGVPVMTDDVVIPFVGIRPDPQLSVSSTIHSMALRKGTEFVLHASGMLSIE